MATGCDSKEGRLPLSAGAEYRKPQPTRSSHQDEPKQSPPSDRTNVHHRPEQLLRANGLRATSSRVAVLQVLGDADAPMSHAQVVAKLEAQQSGLWDKTTVYRNLLDFVRVGLARRTDLGDHVWRFETAHKKDLDRFAHPHFICTDCGDVACMPQVRVSLPVDASRDVLSEHEPVEVQLRGRCGRCRGVVT